MMNFTEARHWMIKRYYSLLERWMKPLVNRGVSPNAITIFSLCLSLVSALFYAFGAIFMGGILLLLSGIADTIDGSIARMTGQSSRFGALLDSTLDRYAEFFVFFGLLFYYQNSWMFYVVMPALLGSVMVSYVKARAESLGSIRVVGLMQRPERLILLSAGSLLNAPIGRYFPECPDCIFMGTLIVLAVLTNITVIHRLIEGKKDLSQTE